MRPSVKIFGYEKRCYPCKLAKQFAESKKLDFGFVNIDEQIKLDENKALLSKAKDYHYIPKVFVDNKFIGGFDELQKKFQ